MNQSECEQLTKTLLKTDNKINILHSKLSNLITIKYISCNQKNYGVFDTNKNTVYSINISLLFVVIITVQRMF